jgi:hypothetical protein
LRITEEARAAKILKHEQEQAKEAKKVCMYVKRDLV